MGSGRKGPEVKDRYENVRAWLQLQRTRLSQGVETSLTDLGSDKHHLADLEELASDVNVDEVVFEHFRSSSDTMHQIERALERLQEGSYETCEVCGSTIDPERLEALPWATECVSCKRISEKTAG